MADDIRRFLGNEPIHARPPSAAYRLRKFARRNRAALSAAGGALAAVVLALGALGYGLLQARAERDATAYNETVARAQMLLTSMNSIRKYTGDNVRPALAKAFSGKQDAMLPDYNKDFVREMVPGFSARAVYANFRQDPAYKTFVYKEAAPNPTNHDNLADNFESDLVARFKNETSTRELSGFRDVSGTRHFYLARPIPVGDAKCLDCHTTPQMAPPKQLELYGRTGGFNWKMNEIVAAQVVYVPVSEAFHAKSMALTGVFVVLGAVFVIGGVACLILMLRRA